MKRPLAIICLVYITLLACYMKISKIPSFSLGEKEGKILTIEGIVCNITHRDQAIIIELKNLSTNLNLKFMSNNKLSPQYILCYLIDQEEPKMGSVVTVVGKATEFTEATNPGEFDFKRYYQLKDCYFSIRNAKIMKQSENYSKYEDTLYQLRCKWSKKIKNLFQQPYSGIMQSLLLGDKTELQDESKDFYQRAGIAHILAISGLHISILGMGGYRLLIRIGVPIPISTSVILVLIIQFGKITGMGSSTYRAILMFSTYLISIWVKRSYDMINAISLSAILLVMEQPYYLFHTGFQLSFAAVFGISILIPILEKIFPSSSYLKKEQYQSHSLLSSFKLKIRKRINKIRKGLRTSLLSTGCISAITLPILLSNYYVFPLYSFLLNLIVVPLVGVILFVGLGAILISQFSHSIARIMAYFCTLLLSSFEIIGKTIEYFPLNQLSIGKPSNISIICYYGIIIIIFGLNFILYQGAQKKKLKWKKRNSVCLFGIGIGIALFILCSRPNNTLQIVMQDVGQGDGIYVMSPNGTHIYIDGGSSNKKKLFEYQWLPFLKSYGVSYLDYVFLSHMDSDHIAAIKDNLEHGIEGKEYIPIKFLVLTEYSLQSEEGKELYNMARELKTTVIQWGAGDYMIEKDMKIRCILPISENPWDTNQNSMVLLLQYKKFSMLFTGDIDEKVEPLMLSIIQEEQLLGINNELTVLKLAHHGSKNSSSKNFLNSLQIKHAFISSGRNNGYGHPHQEVIEQLKELEISIHNTQDTGAILLNTDGQRISIKHFRANKS